MQLNSPKLLRRVRVGDEWNGGLSKTVARSSVKLTT